MAENAKLANLDLDIRQIMLVQEREIREMQELRDGINKLLSMVVSRTDIPEWLTLEQACALKGANTYNTVKQRFWLKPGAGLPKFQKVCGGRIVYNRDEVILPWLNVTQENLLYYLTSVCGLSASSLPRKLVQELEAAAKQVEQSVSVPQEVAV